MPTGIALINEIFNYIININEDLFYYENEEVFLIDSGSCIDPLGLSGGDIRSRFLDNTNDYRSYSGRDTDACYGR